MVEQIEKTFVVNDQYIHNLLNELKHWNIVPDENKEGYSFYLQSNNRCYHIQLNVEDRFTSEEKLFMFNAYPRIHSFVDLQMKLFNKVIWNWK